MFRPPIPVPSVVPVLALLAACGPGAEAVGPGTSSDAAPLEVRTALAARVPWERSVAVVGELAAQERVVVATKVAGRLALLACDRGDRLERGALVAALETREYELRVEQAEAAVAVVRAQLGLKDAAEEAADALDPEATAVVRFAQAELRRAQLERERSAALTRVGVDSQALADRAEAEFRAAESRLQEAYELVATRRATLAQRRAELAIARAQLAETRIEAPFDGLVQARLTATGAYLGAGAAVVELVRDGPLRVLLEVAERDAGEVRLGQRVRLEGAAQGLTAELVRLAPALARESRALLVEAELADPQGRLRAGTFVQARIVVAEDEQVMSVPPEAIHSFAGLDKVFVLQDGRAQERRVELGRRTAERVEVRTGLSGGEQVVLAPGRLSSGRALRVVSPGER